jgi:hypothetical protein
MALDAERELAQLTAGIDVKLPFRVEAVNVPSVQISRHRLWAQSPPAMPQLCGKRDYDREDRGPGETPWRYAVPSASFCATMSP